MIRATFSACALALGLFLLPLQAASAMEIREVTSPGGIKAWLVEEHGLPLVSFAAAFRDAGSASDPAGQEGMAVILSGLLNEGAGDMDAAAYKRALEERAISLGMSADSDNFYFSFSTLSEHREEAFRLLSLALTSPRFDADAVERVKSQMYVAQKQVEEDPESLAGNVFNDLAFPGHPYGRRQYGSPETVGAISADSLRGFMSARFARDNLFITVVGDISAEELGQRLDALFGGLNANAAPHGITDVTMAQMAPMTVIRQENPQSVVVFGAPGLRIKDADFMTANVMNYVLGGGSFSSRLMTEVREKRGLAYGVSTFLVPNNFSGVIMGQVATDNARVAESISVIKAELERMRTEGVTDAELTDAKAYLTGSFALRFDSNGRIASQLLGYQLDELGIDYVLRRNQLIEAVTREDIARVAASLLDSGKFGFVVVGAPEGL